MARSTQPVFASTLSTFDQVRPPSRVLYTPRSGFAPHSRPSAATYTVRLSLGSHTMRAMLAVASSPMFFHEPPPSSERYTPLPQPEELRPFASPVPSHTSSGFFWNTATAPVLATASVSNTACQVVPWLFVLNSP